MQTLLQLIEENQLLQLIGTVVFTLLGKWIWDRWLSESSRVSKFECERTRKVCQSEIMFKLTGHSEDLNEGESHFKMIDAKMTALALTLIKICEKMQIDCGDITKIMINHGVIE